jgi:hypothetical protein
MTGGNDNLGLPQDFTTTFSSTRELLRLRSNCGNIFCGKILVPVNDRVFAKNVSQIFRSGQIGPICPEPVARKNLGNKFHGPQEGGEGGGSSSQAGG